MSTQAPPRRYTSSVIEPRSRGFINTSVGTKILIGVTGLLLVLYLFIHIFGNLLVFFGPAVFNGYAAMMLANPLVVPIEIGLLGVFLIHIYKTLTNWLANRRARPVGYYRRKWGGKPSRKTIASSTMIVSGLILLLFIPIHVAQMKYGVASWTDILATSASGGEHDLYAIEMAVFSNPLNVIFYCFTMIVVGSHLYHGIHSGFASLGADHPKYTPWIIRAGKVIAVLVGFGFFIIPIWAYFIAAPASGAH